MNMALPAQLVADEGITSLGPGGAQHRHFGGAEKLYTARHICQAHTYMLLFG